MKKVLLLLLLLLGFRYADAQITPSTVKVDTVITKVQGSKSFYVRNPSNKTIQVTGIRTLLSQFYFTTTPFSINPYDSVLVTVLFKTNQNVTYRDFFIFETRGLKYPLVYYLLGTAKYSESYYAFSQGLYDEVLKSAIKTFTTTGHIPLTYNTARDAMYGTIDHYESPDTIECVYTGRKAIVRTRTEATNQNFNCEHTLPQSFFNENPPMVCDLFHLYPTDETANSYRSNYPFGKVVANITWQNGGSKLGRDSTNEIVFEPRDVHKGNVARSLFYFCVTYPTSFGTFMSAKQENILRQWNVLDTVDAKEKLRNTRIHTAQNTYNPFIDHPELVDRITSVITTANAAPKAKISAAPFNVQFDTVAANDTTSYYIAVMNYGNAALTIASAVSNLTQFVVESVPSSIPQGEMRYIKVKFRPTTMYQTYTGTLTVSNSDTPLTINLKGYCGYGSAINLISTEVPDKFGLEQNYPNPFNPATTIRFSVPANGRQSIVTVKVFDMLGREVETLVNRTLGPGVYEVPFSAAGKTGSGIYFVQLAVDNEQLAIRKMVMAK